MATRAERLERYRHERQSVAPKEAEDRSFRFDVRALTPIYKGSAKPNGVDERYPFRGPSLRGQLRLWWRATRPETTAPALWHAENLLFGGVHQGARASRVSIGLSEMKSDTARKAELARRVGSDLPYALWVDRGDDVVYHVNARAQVHVELGKLNTADEPDDDLLGTVRPALQAMVLFGGSGSRTRRGLGALWSDEILGDPPRNVDELIARIAPLCPPKAARAWPSLGGVRVAWSGEVHSRPAQALQAALEVFKSLRGMRALGGGRFDGFTRLPEAQQDWLGVRDGRNLDDAFTAALGMPLAYRSSNNHLIGTTIVKPSERGADRLPSPVHVRPIPVPGGYTGVVLALRPWYSGRITAKNGTMRRNNHGSLAANAVDVLLGGFESRGWVVRGVGGA